MLATGELAPADLDPEEANNISGTPGPESNDTIVFHPLLFPADEPAIISLIATLPTLATGSDTVDGSGVGVIVDGGNQGFNCLQIDSHDNTIKGLQIQNCRTAILYLSLFLLLPLLKGIAGGLTRGSTYLPMPAGGKEPPPTWAKARWTLKRPPLRRLTLQGAVRPTPAAALSFKNCRLLIIYVPPLMS